MAAATMAGLEAHRMEEKKMEYFSSISSMARKIMQERESIKAQHGPGWDRMTPQEQDAAIDNRLMEPHIRARYAMHRVEREEVQCYPTLRLLTGQKVVHFGEEDITWQDEHSAPFCWETKSQLDFSLSPGSSDQLLPAPQLDCRPAKLPHGVQLGKSAGTKDEESSFWKISAERSRLEGGQEDFQTLTPSQIKSLEKGEKTLPSYLRQESSKEPEVPEPLPPPVPRPTKQRAPKPPAPPPPAPVAVSATPASLSMSPVPPSPVPAAVWERSQSTLPSVSNAPDDVFASAGRMSRPPGGVDTKEDQAVPDANAAFSQFNTSSNVLKTGFDFLDNW